MSRDAQASQPACSAAAPSPDGEAWQDLLGRVERLAADQLAPRANATDQLPLLPPAHLDWLAALGLLGLNVPRRFGGLDAPYAVQQACTATLAAACGVTTFVWQQHLAACSLVARAANEPLQAALLPRLARGERRAGVGFSHLRRGGPPLLRVTPTDDGYVFDGTAPWVTGWGLFDDVVLGGTLPDGRLLYALVPLVASEALGASAPLRLCAMNASGTVALTCRGLHVPAAHGLFTSSRAEMLAHDRAGTLKPTALTFGLARAADALVREQALRRGEPALLATADALAAELQAARQAVAEWTGRAAEAAGAERALALRAWAIALAVRHAHAAVAISGGSANSRDHPAQRLYREALLYTVLTQTPDVQAATLAALAAEAQAAVQRGAVLP